MFIALLFGRKAAWTPPDDLAEWLCVNKGIPSQGDCGPLWLSPGSGLLLLSQEGAVISDRHVSFFLYPSNAY